MVTRTSFGEGDRILVIVSDGNMALELGFTLQNLSLKILRMLGLTLGVCHQRRDTFSKVKKEG